MSLLSRSVTAAFVDTAELFTAVENTKLMWTQRQRQMAKDALKASSERFEEMMARHGVSLEEAYGDEHGAIATIELKPRRPCAGASSPGVVKGATHRASSRAPLTGRRQGRVRRRL